MALEFREISDAIRRERIAYAIAHGAYVAVRALESKATFGIDIFEAQAQSDQIASTQDPRAIDDTLAFLRRWVTDHDESFAPAGTGPEVSAPKDEQGEQQIGYDSAAWDAASHAGAVSGVVLVGEEDEFRALGPRGPEARGERIAFLIEHDMAFAVVDPLDGSNQAAGMGQRSGWASCAMVYLPGAPGLAAAVLLGDGRGFVCADGQIWLSESAHPDRPTLQYRLDPAIGFPGFERAHFVIPAAKRSSLDRAQAILAEDDEIQWISPLGGNPGILAAMLCAGALAAVQPAAYAWDHMAPLILAEAGFPVIGEDHDEPLDSSELTVLLLGDLVAGRKTEALYVGRTLELAHQLRNASRRAAAQ